jgi:hypothetical protein
MTLLEDIKKTAERVTGWRRLGADELAVLLRRRKPATFRFRDDGEIPNHPYWPLVIYRSAVKLPCSLAPAAVLEDLFESNGWGDSWRNGRRLRSGALSPAGQPLASRHHMEKGHVHRPPAP